MQTRRIITTLGVALTAVAFAACSYHTTEEHPVERVVVPQSQPETVVVPQQQQPQTVVVPQSSPPSTIVVEPPPQ